jgi:Xaa-Pro aminopeptidase
VLSELRLVKDPFELEQLEDAVRITERGFTDVVRDLPRAVELGERWIEGTFWRRARLEGNDVGYTSIVAGGAHATTLHWIDNDGPVRPGDMLLLDMGAENRQLYTADVTRTLPVAGRFTGVAARPLHAGVRRAVGRDRARSGPARGSATSIARRCACWRTAWPTSGCCPARSRRRSTSPRPSTGGGRCAGPGHMLGLDVHDCAKARADEYVDGTLQPGHTLTVDPALLQ